MNNLLLREKLSDEQKVFCEEYTIHLDRKKAAEAVGISYAVACNWVTGKPPHVRKYIDTLLHQKTYNRVMTAEEVNKYIATIMLFEPLQFFTPAEGGGWLIEDDKWDTLPPYIGCLIEHVEKRSIVIKEGKKTTIKSVCWVKLVSKTQAMIIAAKTQLGEKLNVTNMNIDWNDIMKRGKELRECGGLENIIKSPLNITSQVNSNGMNGNGQSNGSGSNNNNDNGEKN